MSESNDNPAVANSPGGRRCRTLPYMRADLAAAYGVGVPSESSERFLSPNDIGKILNVTGEAVKQWIYHRRLPAVKLANGFWKVKVSDFEAFLKARYAVTRRQVLLIGNPSAGLTNMVAAIEHLGHQAAAANNYADAILKVLDGHPDLLIISLALQAGESWKLIEKVRTAKALRRIPILLISDVDLTDEESNRAAGLSVQGFLKQPIDQESLKTEIRRILR